jgi:hypothetical protein
VRLIGSDAAEKARRGRLLDLKVFDLFLEPVIARFRRPHELNVTFGAERIELSLYGLFGAPKFFGNRRRSQLPILPQLGQNLAAALVCWDIAVVCRVICWVSRHGC